MSDTDLEKLLRKTRKGAQMHKVSNYEMLCEDWRKRFLTMDQNDICARLPEVKMKDEHLTLWHFGRQFAVNRTDGAITVLSDDKPVDITPKMNIYTLFWYCSPDALLSGEWAAFRELKDGAPFSTAFQNGIAEPLAATFTGNENRLISAVQKLRGQRLQDNGFVIPAFDCIPVKLHLWDADDEFPAQANILFDKNATDYIHIESIVTIASEALYQLADVAALPLKANAFFRY
jgi:hypothetical protein